MASYVCTPALRRATKYATCALWVTPWREGEGWAERKRNTISHRRISNHFDSVAWQCTHWMITKHTRVMLVEWPEKRDLRRLTKNTLERVQFELIWTEQNVLNRQYDVMPQIEWQNPYTIHAYPWSSLEFSEWNSWKVLPLNWISWGRSMDIACRLSIIFTSLKSNGFKCTSWQ